MKNKLQNSAAFWAHIQKSRCGTFGITSAFVMYIVIMWYSLLRRRLMLKQVGYLQKKAQNLRDVQAELMKTAEACREPTLPEHLHDSDAPSSCPTPPHAQLDVSAGNVRQART